MRFSAALGAFEHLTCIVTILATTTPVKAAIPPPTPPPPPTPWQLANRNRTIHLGMILFPGWEPLDVIGPLEFIHQASSLYQIKLYTIASKVGRVSSKANHPSFADIYKASPELWATHTFKNAPKLDVLIKPGGAGDIVRALDNDTSIERFIQKRFGQLQYLMSVCTGSTTLARAGVLRGRKATTNKGLWEWGTSEAVTGGSGVEWVPSARWTVDGKVWTSSGVAAGMDMIYAWLVHFYGADVIDRMFNQLEYAPHTDPDWDPFSIVHDVPGASQDGPLESCVGPAGF